MRRGFAFSSGLVAAFLVTLCAYGSLSAPADAADPGFSFSVLHSFTDPANKGTGIHPVGDLTPSPSGSILYGMTPTTVFKMNRDGTGFKTLRTFSGGPHDGSNAVGSLVLSGSMLYGMTSGGGTANAGTVFQIGTGGAGFKVLHSFLGGPGDGNYPLGSLTLVGSTLYGMTSLGGTGGPKQVQGGSGTIFKIGTNGLGYQVIYNFNGYGVDGQCPKGTLTALVPTDPKGTIYLYGMTNGGGTGGGSNGIIFRIKIDGSDFRLFHSFGDSGDGSMPTGSLTLVGSTLYGMTQNGVGGTKGVIFQINTDGTWYKIIHPFLGGASDGALPYGSLTLSGSNLFGMTYSGGPNNPADLGDGVIFQIKTDGTGFTPLHSFSSGRTDDGAQPKGTLVAVGTALYGMTEDGGDGQPSPGGVVFSLTNAPSVDTPTSSSVTSTGAGLGANISSDDGFTVTASGVAYGKNAYPTVSPSNVSTKPVATGGPFIVDVTGLKPNTLYHYRGYATNSAGTGYTADAAFTTQPAVSSPTATNITSSGATLGATVGSGGGEKITASGVAYDTNPSPIASGSHVSTSKPVALGLFTVNLTGLTPNTVYHYRGYAVNSGGTNYTADATFTTMPEVIAPTSSNITSTGATLGAAIGSSGGAQITATGVAYGTSANPTVSPYHVRTKAVATGGPFTVDLTGLKPNTIYHYRGYATNSQGTSYTADTILTTLPAVSAPTATSITLNGATLGATIGPNSGPKITASGVVYGTSANPDVSGTHMDTSTSVVSGVFKVNVTGLLPNTPYHYRGYATSPAGTSYTADASFTTSKGPPGVIAPTSSSITSTGATLGANIGSDGGFKITDSGIAYGTSASPIASGLHVSTSPLVTNGPFTVKVPGLLPNTLYHYRGYATNSKGTSYTADQTFTTSTDLVLSYTGKPMAKGYFQGDIITATFTLDTGVPEGNGSSLDGTHLKSFSFTFTNAGQTWDQNNATVCNGFLISFSVGKPYKWYFAFATGTDPLACSTNTTTMVFTNSDMGEECIESNWNHSQEYWEHQSMNNSAGTLTIK